VDDLEKAESVGAVWVLMIGIEDGFHVVLPFVGVAENREHQNLNVSKLQLCKRGCFKTLMHQTVL